MTIRRRGLALATALVLSTTAAFAQAVTTFTLSADDSTKFKTWVTAQKPVAVPAPAGFTVAVGAVLPQTVQLVEIPATVGIASITPYRYVMLGDKVVLVNPADRKIVYIVG